MQRTSEEPLSGETSGQNAAPATLRRRVLVIDDEPLLGQTIRLGLRDSLDVTCELTGEQGLFRALSNEEYEVVLCDLSLPDRPGGEIFAELLAKRPELSRRFVVMTGGAVNDEAREFLDAHGGLVLTKPFTLGDVERIIDKVVAQNDHARLPGALALSRRGDDAELESR